MSWAQVRREQAWKKLRRIDAGDLLQRDDPLATAHHEAAHAVCAEAFGISVIWATCYPITENGQRMLGYVKTQEDAFLNGAQAIVHALVGDIAEYPLLFGGEYAFDDYMSSSDGTEIVEICKSCNPDSSFLEMFDTVKAASEEASELVRQAKHWITPVAIEMYAHKTVRGERIRFILKQGGFYKPQNPLLQFYLRARILQMVYMGKKAGVPLPESDENGVVWQETMVRWFVDNAPTLEPILLGGNAGWNCAWGKNKGEALSREQVRELVSCSSLLERFGAKVDPAAVLAEMKRVSATA